MINRRVENWDHAAEDAYTHLTARMRDYQKAKMLAVMDLLCMRGIPTQAEMIDAHESADLISTTLGHVTAKHREVLVLNLEGE
jgi:hypothetical protein